MDYAQLSRFQIQSVTDQEDYLKLPAIVTGASAGVLPEQLGVWSYPTADSDSDKASFNLVTAMMGRIHQSGRLDKLSANASNRVAQGIDLYKRVLRRHVPQATPFFPLGMPDLTNRVSPIALGMRAPELTWIAVWRLDGPSRVTIPTRSKTPRILYPEQAGIIFDKKEEQLVIEFPRTRMGCLFLI